MELLQPESDQIPIFLRVLGMRQPPATATFQKKVLTLNQKSVNLKFLQFVEDKCVETFRQILCESVKILIFLCVLNINVFLQMRYFQKKSNSSKDGNHLELLQSVCNIV